ncbi:PHP domain-containing protein [Microlunatus flavus]|nr:PHP domain-containing protein [Microlunatus flavus]
MLPLDGHVHSEWSWDAFAGDMEATCARAVELGLPAVAFTEHVDHTRWLVSEGALDPRARGDHKGDTFVPGPLAVESYLGTVERCRDRFPGLTVLSGVELGEPHWHAEAVARVLAAGPLDRVLGSLHSLPEGAYAAEPPELYRRRDAAEVVRSYLAELAVMVAQTETFEVLAHLDYPLRHWPTAAGPFEVGAFEDAFRHALRTLAGTGRVLEVNTKGPMLPELVGWWREEGGRVVTFGSDAHEPAALGHRLGEAVAMVESFGFRPGRHPYDRWTLPG